MIKESTGALLAALIGILNPAPCFAWGAEGHRIIAMIAADNLTPAGKHEVEALLHGDALVSMAEASTWADEIRSERPYTARWHFVDIPVGSTGYDQRRDCRKDDCVVAQINRNRRIVADRRLASAIRADALRFLIHFIGDIHQPLHAADNRDRGGSRFRVVLRNHRTDMHAVWDVDLVRAVGRGPEQVSAHLERAAVSHRVEWSRGAPAEWANESFQIADREIYRGSPASESSEPVILPQNYARTKSQVAAIQLAKAGLRLAAALK